MADTGSNIDCRIRISDVTLELVTEDVVEGGSTDRVWESIDVMNPYAGTSLSSTRVQAAFDEAEAGYGLDYCAWPALAVHVGFHVGRPPFPRSKGSLVLHPTPRAPLPSAAFPSPSPSPSP